MGGPLRSAACHSRRAWTRAPTPAPTTAPSCAACASPPDCPGASWAPRSSAPVRTSACWRRRNGDCVEIADNLPAIDPVRDSKAATEGPALAFARARRVPFVAALGEGSLRGALRRVPGCPEPLWETGSPAGSRSRP
ncbi:DUF397 domain-containing protein [Streptomyces sp. NPDC005780]|uniref:DUF397 domain-containing protein n=1 Tax=Streptomyces sp. NPDC005780 TaxID=3364730 RepID=UPI00368149D7